MNYPRVLTIQDLSCFGQCSLTVALPILSACGVETTVLPTALLSTHTGGFQGFTFLPLADEMEKIMAHWQREKIHFHAIYTGYLGEKRHAAIVRQFKQTVLDQNGLIVIDPAFADHGKLYTGFDDNYVEHMRSLVAEADYLLPNMTEACMLTGTPFEEHQNPEQAELLIHKLKSMGAKNVVLKGVHFFNGNLGVAISQGDEVAFYQHRRIEHSYHGTGDIFASVFTGAVVKGRPSRDAAKTAADFVVRCIEKTDDDVNHPYGVKFELALHDLTDRFTNVK